MKRWVKVLLSVTAVVVFVLLFGLSAMIGMQVFQASTQLVTNAETSGVPLALLSKNDVDYEGFLHTYQVEELVLTSSFDGHKIPADYIYAANSQNSKHAKTVILVHGLGDNRYANYPQAVFFLEKGYNVITYDQRSTNENTAQYTTFGYWEKYDLIDCINYAEKQAPGEKIGVWGASFGGATAALAAGYESTDDKIDFLILDCPVSSMQWMVEKEMQGMDVGIPVPYMALCGNVVNRLKLGFTYRDADVARAVKELNVPVLIINSSADEMTPSFMGIDIFNALPQDMRTIWTVDNSAHCEIWSDYNAEYRAAVDSFLLKCE